MKILITDVIKDKALVEKKIFGKKYSIKVCGAKKNSDISEKTLSQADAVLFYDSLQIDKNFINKLKKCKVLVRVGVGLDNVDLQYAKRAGIPVCNVPDYGVDEVADYAMGSILFANRNFLFYLNNTLKKKWVRESSCFRLEGRTLGIIGLGRIGSALAVRAKAFKMNVVFYDPYVESGKDKVLNIKRLFSLKNIAEQSDFVSLHCPLSEETHNIIDKNFFKYSKKNLVLINSARGKNVNLDDLRIALKFDKINAAILDVLPKEPISSSHKLLNEYLKKASYLENRLIITPHAAFYSDKSIVEIRQKGALEAKRILDGNKPLNCVNNFYENY